MKVYILKYEADYDGQVLLGIYNDKQLAQEALQDYASSEDNEGSEPFLEIVEVSMNDKPNWYFTNPELQFVIKTLNP
jgi:hypothetical protein